MISLIDAIFITSLMLNVYTALFFCSSKFRKFIKTLLEEDE